jgi:hypothetical protein
MVAGHITHPLFPNNPGLLVRTITTAYLGCCVFFIYDARLSTKKACKSVELVYCVHIISAHHDRTKGMNEQSVLIVIVIVLTGVCRMDGEQRPRLSG